MSSPPKLDSAVLEGMRARLAARALFGAPHSTTSAEPDASEMRAKALRLANALLDQGLAATDIKERTSALATATNAMKVCGLDLVPQTAVSSTVIEVIEASDPTSEDPDAEDRTDGAPAHSASAQSSADARATAH